MARVKKVQFSYPRKMFIHVVMVLRITIKRVFRKTTGASGVCELTVYVLLL